MAACTCPASTGLISPSARTQTAPPWRLEPLTLALSLHRTLALTLPQPLTPTLTLTPTPTLTLTPTLTPTLTLTLTLTLTPNQAPP